MGSGVSNAIMFVCQACICRSPLMAFTFAQAARHDARAVEWRVTSSGVAVRRSAPICELSASLFIHEPAGRSFAASHASTPLLADEVVDLDLVITASREERGAVARLSPSTRGRTFTLREAIALGREPLASAELQSVTSGKSAGQSPIGGYAALLNSRRGRVSITPPRLRSPWAPASHPEDFPDVHHYGRVRHLAGLKDLQEMVRTLHLQVSNYIVMAESARI